MDDTMALIDQALPTVEELQAEIIKIKAGADKKNDWMKEKLVENSQQASTIKNLQQEKDDMRMLLTNLELEKAKNLTQIAEMNENFKTHMKNLTSRGDVSFGEVTNPEGIPLGNATRPLNGNMDDSMDANTNLDDTNPDLVALGATRFDIDATQPHQVALDPSQIFPDPAIQLPSASDIRSQITNQLHQEIEKAKKEKLESDQKLALEINQLKADNDKLTTKLDQAKVQIEDQQLENSTEAATFKQKMADFTSDLDMKNKTIDNLTLATKQAQDFASNNSNEAIKLQTDLQQQLSEKDKLAEDLRTAIADLENDAAKQTTVYEELRLDYDKANLTNEDKIRKWHDEVVKLQNEILKLTDEKTATAQKSCEDVTKILDMTVCMDRLEAENCCLNEAKKDDSEVLNKLKQEIHDLKVELDQLKTENFEKVESEANLQTKLEAAIDQDRKSSETYSNLREESSKLRGQYEELMETTVAKEQQQRSEIETMTENEEQFRQQIQKLTSEKESSLADYVKVQSQLLTAQNQSQTDFSKIKTLENDLQQLQTSYGNVNKDLGEAKAQYSQAQQDISAQKELITASTKTLELEKETILKKLEKNKVDLESLAQENLKFKKSAEGFVEKMALNEKILSDREEEVKKAMSFSDKVISRLDESKAEIEKLTLGLTDSNCEKDNLKEANEKLNDDISKLETKLKEVDTVNKSLNSKITGSTTELDDLSKLLAEKSALAEQLSNDIDDSINKISGKEVEIAKLMKDNQELDEAAKDAISKSEDLKAELDEFNQSSNEKFDGINVKLEEAQKKIKEVEEDALSARSGAVEKTESIKKLEDELVAEKAKALKNVTDLAEERTKYEELVGRFEQLTNDQKSLESKFSETTSKSELDQNLAESQIKDISTKLETVEESLKAAQLELDQKSAIIEDLGRFKKDFQEKTTTDKVEREKFSKTHELLNKDYDDVLKNFKNLEKKVKDMDSENALKLYELRLSSKKDIIKVETLLKEKEGTIIILEEKFQTESKTFKEASILQTETQNKLLLENCKLLAEKDELKIKVDKLEEKIESGQDLLTNLKAANEALEKDKADGLVKDMKLMSSPSAETAAKGNSTSNAPAATLSRQFTDSNGQPMNVQGLEKEVKRLKSRNERIIKAMNDTNDKNRAFQTKLKKYYTICAKNNLLPGKESVSGQGQASSSGLQPLKENNDNNNQV